jgi:hypothetical protein
MSEIDRRHLKRFKVPDSEIEYKVGENNTSRVPLSDITKISVRFEVEHDINAGDMIELEIMIPKKKKISVKGKVVRTSDPDADVKPFAAVQFIPFGSDERYNTMKSYKQLSELSDELESSDE